jgi:hypothetical protein
MITCTLSSTAEIFILIHFQFATAIATKNTMPQNHTQYATHIAAQLDTR